MSILAWVWISLGVLTLLFAVFRSRWFWLIWMLQLVSLGFIYTLEREWSVTQMASIGPYIVITVYGAMRWFQNPQKIWQHQYNDLLDADAHEIDWSAQKKLRNMSVEAVVGWVLLTIVFTAAMAALHKPVYGRVAGILGLYHSLGILGGLLIAHRMRAVWFFWLGKAALGMWLFAPNLYLQFAELSYFILALLGWIYWRTTWKQEQGIG